MGLNPFEQLGLAGLAIMLNFNSSEVGLIEVTDDTDGSMESLFNIRAEKNLYRLNFCHWGKGE